MSEVMMQGDLPNPRVYSKADYDRLEAENKELKARLDHAEMVGDSLAGALSDAKSQIEALRSRVVVVPGRSDHFRPISFIDGWNACLDKLARLNGKMVSEGLLRRALYLMELAEVDGPTCRELRALLDEGREVGDAAGH